MRASTNIQTKERRLFQVDDLKGVDFYSSRLQVQANRASNAKNWIRKDGVLQKRNGWKELFNLGLDRINGIFPYQNRERTELLVYCGRAFYRVYQDLDEEWVTENLMDQYSVSSEELVDSRCSFFYHKGDVFIIGCGKLLRYGKYSYVNDYTYEEFYGMRVREVTKSEAYIPTTTISINSKKRTDALRKTFEPVNLLNPLRKNKLLGESFAPDDEIENAPVWRLDGRIDTGWRVEITVESNFYDLLEIYEKSGTLYGYFHGEGGEKEVGSVDHEKGEITLTIDTTPPIAGRDNITVTFAHTDYDSYKKRSWIEKCQFGALFGVGGATDRIFLAGNPDFPNIEFFSEADDFTYWPDQNTATVGTDQNAITGFLRLSDNSLAIFKENGVQEPTVFFQSGNYRESGTLGDTDYKITPVFSITAGPITESAVNAYTCTNFAGDNLILSENGVFGIENAENISTNVRLARERSLLINPKLTQSANLKDAASIAWRGKYYLSVDDCCYVADSNYKTQLQDSSAINYEWWYWENIPARVWAVVNDTLWFGTKDGSLCCFDDQFSDRGHVISKEGQLSFDYNANTVTVDPDLDALIQEGKTFSFLTKGVFATYMSGFIRTDEESLYVDSSVMGTVYEGKEVYTAYRDEEWGQISVTRGPYYIGWVDHSLNCFALLDETGFPLHVIDLNLDGFLLVEHISNTDLIVRNKTEGSFQLSYPNHEEILDLVSGIMPITDPVTLENTGYVISPTEPIAKFFSVKNVVAEWYTPIFNFGTFMSSKTLYKISVSTLPISKGKLKFGYETRAVSKDFLMKGMRSFSFEDFSFLDFSFDTGFQSSYTVKAKEPNFNHIMFRFLSDNDCNCALNGFAVLYKINKQNIGVR